MRTFLKHNHADQCDLNLLQTSSLTGCRGCIVSCVFNFHQVEVIGVGSAASASCHASPADKKVALAQILRCPFFFFSVFILQNIIRHICFHLHEKWSHSWVRRAAGGGEIEIQPAQREAIRRRRLQISVIEGCCFGSQTTLHNQCVLGCEGVVGTVRQPSMDFEHYPTCRHTLGEGVISS